MRIFPRKAFRFEIGLDRFQCMPGKIQDMPDKFAKSKMFRMAAAEGSVDVLSTPTKQRKAENDSATGRPDKSGGDV